MTAVCISPEGAVRTGKRLTRRFWPRLCRTYGVDLVVLAGCLVVIPKEIMVDAYAGPDHQHPSGADPGLSAGPAIYGLKVHEAALERGVKVTGATVHFVDAGTDTGPILLQKAVEVPGG